MRNILARCVEYILLIVNVRYVLPVAYKAIPFVIPRLVFSEVVSM